MKGFGDGSDMIAIWRDQEMGAGLLQVIMAWEGTRAGSLESVKTKSEWMHR